MLTNQIIVNITWVLVALSLAAGLFGTVLFTELGQLLNLPSKWLYAVYPYLGKVSIVLIAIAVFVIIQQFRLGVMSHWLAIGYIVVLLGTIFLTNYFVPDIWLRGHHHTAKFTPVSEADTMLDDKADVFVIEIAGEARAYPRDWMMVPHIAGDKIGGEDVVMTYCALSNLPLAFSSHLEGKEMNLKVVSQVHNNLVMVDNNNGELFQQITSTTPDQRTVLDPQAAQRMPWGSFKTLYPDGQVFSTVNPGGLLGILDKITYTLFVSSLEGHYTESDPMFPTLSMDDDRLPAQEQIWGINLGGEQVGFAQSFFKQNPVYNTIIGETPVVVAWFLEYETLGVFSRDINEHVVEVNEIDVYGNTKAGKLQRLPQYPHVFWRVWSHWYPRTEVRM